jgi:hypothetical protein
MKLLTLKRLCLEAGLIALLAFAALPASANDCPAALKFATTPGPNNTAIDTCRNFAIDGTYITARCENIQKVFQDTRADCHNIIENDKNGPYALSNQNGDLSSGHVCGGAVLEWSKTKSPSNSSADTCENYRIDGKYIKAQCRRMDQSIANTQENCEKIWDKAKNGMMIMENYRGSLQVSCPLWRTDPPCKD